MGKEKQVHLLDKSVSQNVCGSHLPLWCELCVTIANEYGHRVLDSGALYADTDLQCEYAYHDRQRCQRGLDAAKSARPCTRMGSIALQIISDVITPNLQQIIALGSFITHIADMHRADLSTNHRSYSTIAAADWIKYMLLLFVLAENQHHTQSQIIKNLHH